ncbi:MAG TPA: isochorismatase family protein [Chloroflexota bacterium]|jgi:nicotinamidase-related amidase
MHRQRFVALLAAALVALSGGPGLLGAPAPAAAQALPTIPAPVAVTLDPATTAYLVLDLNSQVCAPQPGCVATLPAAAALLARARQAGAFVVYSNTRTPGTTILPEVAPLPDDPIVASSADKFFNTNLDEILSSHGIRTTIMVGTAANGAVLYTAFGASTRGYTVVVAEDVIPAPDDFAVFVTRYQLLNQPGFGNPSNEPLRERAVTLSRTDLISFQ